ncbi:hypothetical protein [Amycolatopsis magusensis]|uniref:hypothetical protein n=1 Tax=Amycolatopsis magusensis TaxID=882444 RepID=UPI0037ABC73F
MVTAPFADFTWRHARDLARRGRGENEVTETDIARALDELLTRAEHGPDRAGAQVVARTRTAAAAHRPTPAADAEPETAAAGASALDPQPDAEVIPFGLFDADAEAERWL